MRLPRQQEPAAATRRTAPADVSDRTDPADDSAGRPLYCRLLRLRHVRPGAWQRALLGEGSLALAALLVLADLASAWTLLVLPVAVALVVKAHDVLAGELAGWAAPTAEIRTDTAEGDGPPVLSGDVPPV